MRKNNRFLYLLALVKLVLPFVLQNPLYQPHRDEFLYLAEGNHMAWGYMEVPPLLSVFAWLTDLLGHSMFWVKFWPSLFGALNFILVGKIVQTLGGRWFALLLAFLPFLFTVYLRVHFLFQPNFLEIFFWSLLAYSLVKYQQTLHNQWLYIFGITAGLGMLSKYSVAFYIISLLAGLLLTKPKSLFANKHLYIAAGIGVIIFLPNFMWQYHHNWPVLYHMHELQRTQLQYVSPSGFLKDQLLMFLPVILIWVAGLIVVLFSKQMKAYRFIGLAHFFVIILLIGLHGKNYYSLGAYPVLFAFGALHLEQLTLQRLKFLRYVFVVVAVALGFLLLPVGLPIAKPQKLNAFYKATGIDKTGALQWEDLQNHALPQDFADMLGWEEMAAKAGEAYQSLSPQEKRETFVFADNYGQAGALNYYSNKYNLPICHSDNASFLYWMPHPVHFANLILVTDDQQEMQHDFVHDFQSAQVIGKVENKYAREYGSLIILFKGANEKFNQMFQQKIADDLAEVKR